MNKENKNAAVSGGTDTTARSNASRDKASQADVQSHSSTPGCGDSTTPIFDYVQEFHRGRENAVHLKELASAFGVSERSIIDRVNRERIAGAVIASDRIAGYFFPVRFDELQRYKSFVYSEIQSGFRILEGVAEFEKAASFTLFIPEVKGVV